MNVANLYKQYQYFPVAMSSLHRIPIEIRREICQRQLWQHLLSDILSESLLCHTERKAVYRASVNAGHRFLVQNGYRYVKLLKPGKPNNHTVVQEIKALRIILLRPRYQWRIHREMLVCPYCGEEFTPTGNNQKYSSTLCKDNHYYLTVRKPRRDACTESLSA